MSIKKVVINESKLKQIVKESVKRTLREMADSSFDDDDNEMGDDEENYDENGYLADAKYNVPLFDQINDALNMGDSSSWAIVNKALSDNNGKNIVIASNDKKTLPTVQQAMEKLGYKYVGSRNIGTTFTGNDVNASFHKMGMRNNFRDKGDGLEMKTTSPEQIKLRGYTYLKQIGKIPQDMQINQIKPRQIQDIVNSLTPEQKKEYFSFRTDDEKSIKKSVVDFIFKKAVYESKGKRGKKQVNEISTGMYMNDAIAQMRGGGYDIVPINSFADAAKYKDFTTWCICHYERLYNQYAVENGFKFYFCLRKGFENERPEQGQNCPLDSYGLSMIAVSVDDKGRNTITSRWNHDCNGDDHVMSPHELELLIGKSFNSTFVPGV